MGTLIFRSAYTKNLRDVKSANQIPKKQKESPSSPMRKNFLYQTHRQITIRTKALGKHLETRFIHHNRFRFKQQGSISFPLFENQQSLLETDLFAMFLGCLAVLVFIDQPSITFPTHAILRPFFLVCHMLKFCIMIITVLSK